MSAGHTQGALHLNTQYADIEIRGPEESGVLIAVMSPWGVAAEQADQQPANARRLVACWNACQGLSTEQVQQIDGLLPAKLSYQVMQRDREQLLEALNFAVRFFDQLTPADAERMRAVIAKATHPTP